jgi:isopenicillin-N N-acyltransferase-like protein
VAVLRRARLCSSTNYVLADRERVLDVGTTPDGVVTVPPADDVVVHANHFVSPALVAQDALLPGLPDSACRADRMAALIGERHGRLTVGMMKTILADHAGHPASVCRHQERFATIASLIAEPEHGRLHVAVGNPCERDWVAYSL